MAWAKSRELPMQFLISKEPTHLAESRLALLLSTGDCYVASAKVESSPRSSESKEPKASYPKRLGSLTLYRILARSDLALLLFTGDYGFGRELRVPYENFDNNGTRCILARSGLALLISRGEFIVASVESREFNTQDLTLKEPNTFLLEVAWSPTHSGLKRLGSLTFYLRFLCCFGQESRVLHTVSHIERIQCILAQSDLALLLSKGDYGFRRELRVPHDGSHINAN
ncbi:hypothetical protein Csa_011881 [Cucumis sativus]|uniref:Uncharacterized protein n=1 Tax=Cucumis sativus TaxID=3659 RepID=A0A0A0K328_CUCSA|nr:hypothetical protein Csa_011881 [Cucumis sativus]